MPDVVFARDQQVNWTKKSLIFGIKLSKNFKPRGISNQPNLNGTTGIDMDITLQIPVSEI
jgi:hypothetical protein